ncbi:MAG: Gfo/Idh/MocA family oxidoreductase [Bacteroidaceae bacterium]|nr:Gfo/Idh/MocA family oxidoreductase [Bacteroidaceae bacterium]
MNNGKEQLSDIRVAFVGLGERGRTALRLMLPIKGARIAALCDLRPENVTKALEVLPEDMRPLTFHGPDAYQQAINAADTDLVYICSDWLSHPTIACYAMSKGKDVAIEVPAATSLESIYDLVHTAASTQRKCFLLENACFEKQLQEAIAAIRRGDIGELIHAEGNYYHCLGERWTRWRMEANCRHRGDLYPTHELGPICMAMDIGRTDFLETLVSMDTASLSGPQLYRNLIGEEMPGFQNGDHTTTLIRTRKGYTLLLRHDVMTHQPYDRRLLFIGTRGRIELKDTGHPSHEEMTIEMNRQLIAAMRGEADYGISMADLATWCSIIPLSEESILNGFLPVGIPDFYADVLH